MSLSDLQESVSVASSERFDSSQDVVESTAFGTPPPIETLVLSSELDTAPNGLVPESLISRYAAVAATRASVTQMEDGSYFAEFTLLPGTWAQAESRSETLSEYREVVKDWVHIKLSQGDRDFPRISGIDLNVIAS